MMHPAARPKGRTRHRVPKFLLLKEKNIRLCNLPLQLEKLVMSAKRPRQQIYLVLLPLTKLGSPGMLTLLELQSPNHSEACSIHPLPHGHPSQTLPNHEPVSLSVKKEPPLLVMEGQACIRYNLNVGSIEGSSALFRCMLPQVTPTEKTRELQRLVSASGQAHQAHLFVTLEIRW